jgi:hypothetical protein
MAAVPAEVTMTWLVWTSQMVTLEPHCDPSYSKHEQFYLPRNVSLLFTNSKSPFICEYKLGNEMITTFMLISSQKVFRPTPSVVLEQFTSYRRQMYGYRELYIACSAWCIEHFLSFLLLKFELKLHFVTWFHTKLFQNWNLFISCSYKQKENFFCSNGRSFFP